MREKLKDYSFWVGVVGSVMVLLHTINSQLNIEYIENVIMALLGVLSVAGIVHKPSAKTVAKDGEKENGETQIFENANDKQKDCNTQNCEKVNDETQNCETLIFETQENEKENCEKSSDEPQNCEKVNDETQNDEKQDCENANNNSKKASDKTQNETKSDDQN